MKSADGLDEKKTSFAAWFLKRNLQTIHPRLGNCATVGGCACMLKREGVRDIKDTQIVKFLEALW